MIKKQQTKLGSATSGIKIYCFIWRFPKSNEGRGLGEKLEVNVFTGGNMVKSKAGKGTKVSNAAW